jgi:hypothetical protein
MKNRLLHKTAFLFIFTSFLLPLGLLANLSENDELAAIELNIPAIAKDNNFLLQCIIALLLVMIFGYSAKLLYERKINRK